MAIKVDRVRDFFEQVETEGAGRASREGGHGNEHFRTEENMKNGNNGNGSSGFFVPSKEYQNVPDWAAMPNGGEYKVNIDTGVNQARWDTPPGPETVIDKRTGKPQTVGFPQEADQKNRRADDMTDGEIDKLADERESLLSYEDWRKRVLPDDANITEGQARAAWHRNVAQIARDKGAIRNGESTTLQVLRVYKGKLLEAAKRAQKAGDRALKIAQALQEDESN